MNNMKKVALIVDNDWYLVERLAEFLQEHEYEVLKAFNGKEGIMLLDDGVVDLLFVDLVMPKIDGKQMIQYIREHFPDARFPIVALSGMLIEGNEDVHKIGADFCITKGSTDTMIAHINQFMGELKKQSSFSLIYPRIFGNPGPHPRQFEDELIDAMDLQDAIFESVGMGIFIIDRDFSIIKVNELGLEIVGKSISEVLTRPVTSLFRDSEKHKLKCAMKRIYDYPEQGHVGFFRSIGMRQIRNIVSFLKSNNKPTGWILIMEVMDPLEDQDE